MIKTMKGIFWSIKQNGDISIAIGAFADMDRLPDFDKMVAHPGFTRSGEDSSGRGCNFALLSGSCGGRTRQVQCDAICHGTQHSVP
jgi:hypothetical protein